MSKKTTHVTTQWNPEQACSMLELLDELRDQLWEQYGEQIIRYRIAEQQHDIVDQGQQLMEFIDDDPF